MCEFGFISSLYGGTSSFYKIYLFLVSITLRVMKRTLMNILFYLWMYRRYQLYMYVRKCNTNGDLITELNVLPINTSFSYPWHL